MVSAGECEAELKQKQQRGGQRGDKSNFVPRYIGIQTSAETSDPDGDDLMYSLIDSPEGAQIDPVTGLVIWTPSTPGLYSFTAQVDDGWGGTSTTQWTVNVSNWPDDPLADLDIDSDNDNGVDPPARTHREDRWENRRGKQILVNDDDTDNDSIIDLDDLYIPGDHFTPLVLDLSQFPDPGGVGVKLSHDTGATRIWTKDADNPTRTTNDYIDRWTVYAGSTLGFSSENAIVTFFVEGLSAIAPSVTTIYVELDPDGEGPGVSLPKTQST